MNDRPPTTGLPAAAEPPAASPSKALPVRVATVAIQVALAVGWWLLMDNAHLDWFEVLPSLLFMTIAVGVLFRRPWVELLVRLVHWPLLLIMGLLFVGYIFAAFTGNSEFDEMALLGLQAAASAWTVGWLGDFRTLRHFRVRHLLMATTVVAIVLAVASQWSQSPDETMLAGMSMTLQVAALVQMWRSVQAFAHPQRIATRWQAMGHAVALCVLWVLPLAFLVALTIGIPIPFAGWTRGLNAAILSPFVLGFTVMMGGWVALLVMLAAGLWVGSGWWNSYALAVEQQTGVAVNEVPISPRFFRSVLVLIALVFAVSFVGLIVAAVQ